MGAIPKPVVATAQSSIAPLLPKPRIELSLDSGVFKTETPFITSDQLATNRKRSDDIAQEAAAAAAALAVQQAADEAARLQAAQNVSYANQTGLGTLTGSYGYSLPWGNCVNEPGVNNPGWGNPINWSVTSYTPWIGASVLFYFNHVAVVTGLWSNGDIEIRQQNSWGAPHRIPRSMVRGYR